MDGWVGGGVGVGVVFVGGDSGFGCDLGDVLGWTDSDTPPGNSKLMPSDSGVRSLEQVAVVGWQTDRIVSGGFWCRSCFRW